MRGCLSSRCLSDRRASTARRFVPRSQPLPLGAGTPAFTTQKDGWLPAVATASSLPSGLLAAHNGGTYVLAHEPGGGGSYLLKTGDAGRHLAVVLPSAEPDAAVAFADQRDAIGEGVPSDSNLWLSSADGGQSWQVDPSTGLNALRSGNDELLANTLSAAGKTAFAATHRLPLCCYTDVDCVTPQVGWWPLIHRVAP